MPVKLHYMGKGPRDGEVWVFHCKPCGYLHPFEVGNAASWDWNGDVESPSFHPSLMVFGDDAKRRCHSTITKGMITYHADSFHSLAGKTVPMEDWE